MAGIPNFNSLFRLDGKVVLITGGTRGIGFYIAAAFLQAGASKVIITARKENGLQKAVDELNSIKSVSGKAIGIVGNVSTMNGVDSLATAVKETLHNGRLDILVNNAGASWAGCFEDFDDWKTQKTLDVNVRGPFNLTRRLLPLLISAGSKEFPSRVIIVGSVGGLSVPHIGEHGSIAYNVSKAAAHHLARNLALDLAPHNILTNAIAPGWFPTRLAGPAIEQYGGIERAGADNPLGRLGIPEDIAGAAVFLCSKAGAYVTGNELILDGGKRLLSGNSSKL
ncbi:hypothetical protein H2204_006105 [Knufia peltigerae]|uniref:Uncharacterized protein n=1 Tax=Knufia peltigerae TaxID=1002370 RepID=A0AA39CXZ2_9EURO|nr:hypothetical protein H2204_006105 [Knufia peltigerae]